LVVIATDNEAVEKVEQWNAEVPDGTSVVFEYCGSKIRTKTRGKAMLINGKPKLSLLGVAGAVDIDTVTVSPYRSWVRLNRRGQVNHWVECDFESREAMDLQINEMMRLDSRIESFDTSPTRPVDA
jgi:hypothetical protein